VEKVDTSLDCLQWLVEKLESGTEDKTVIYCRTYKECSRLYLLFLDIFGQTLNLENRIFDMVHSSTSQEIKEYVESSLCNPESKLKVVFATKLLGLGIDIYCNTIVHYGPPNSMDDYLQQIGRAGRNGEQSHAILLYNRNQLRNVEQSVMNLLKNPNLQCLRKIALNDFAKGDNEPLTPHSCCITCAKTCCCDECPLFFSPYELYEKASDDDEDEVLKRPVDEQVTLNVKMSLYELKDKLDKSMLHDGSSYSKPEILHGLSLDMIDNIVSKLDYIFSVDDLVTQCDFSVYETAPHVIEVLCEFLSDVDPNTDVGEDILLT